MTNKISYGFYQDVKELSLDDFISICPIGAGWKPLVRELCEKLFELGWDGHVEQCKEKFGILRFYAIYSSKHLDLAERSFNILANYETTFFNIISEYETKSESTCEVCGQHGMKRRFGRIATLCLNCKIG